MQWFKLPSDFHDAPELSEIFEELGWEGYGRTIGAISILAKNISKQKEPVVELSTKCWCKRLGCRTAALKKLFSMLVSQGVLQLEIKKSDESGYLSYPEEVGELSERSWKEVGKKLDNFPVTESTLIRVSPGNLLFLNVFPVKKSEISDPTDIDKDIDKDKEYKHTRADEENAEKKPTDSTVVPIKKTKPSKPKIPPCPHEEIRDLYHKILPELRTCKILNTTRKKLLNNLWKEDSRHQSLEFWERYFNHIKTSDFLMGRTPSSGGRTQFTADFEWVIDLDHFVNIVENKYHNNQSGQPA
jgi:hypothetical protein